MYSCTNMRATQMEEKPQDSLATFLFIIINFVGEPTAKALQWQQALAYICLFDFIVLVEVLTKYLI